MSSRIHYKPPIGVIICIIAAVGFIGLGIIYAKFQMSDAEYDASVKAGVGDLKPTALSALGIYEEDVTEMAPIALGGYVYEGYDLAKTCKDGVVRTSRYKSVILFFGANELYFFSRSESTTKPNQSSDTSNVFFYKDIVNFSTETVSGSYARNPSATSLASTPNTTSFNYNCFKITTTGGTALEVSIKDVNEIQPKINAMRQLLRTKKQA